MTLYLIALAFPALYALGCGATLFAGEREAGTYEFQRSLPVRAWAVFVGKIVLALVQHGGDVGAHGGARRVLEQADAARRRRSGDVASDGLASRSASSGWRCSFGRCFSPL